MHFQRKWGMRTRLNYYTHACNFYLCLDHYYNYCPSFLQAVVLSLPTKSPSVPPHFSLIHQPSLCLVQPVEDHPQLTLGQEISASKNTDSSVFYTEIETKILNTDSDPQNTDRDSDRYTANYSDLAMKKGKVDRMQTCRTLQK